MRSSSAESRLEHRGSLVLGNRLREWVKRRQIKVSSSTRTVTLVSLGESHVEQNVSATWRASAADNLLVLCWRFRQPCYYIV